MSYLGAAQRRIPTEHPRVLGTGPGTAAGRRAPRRTTEPALNDTVSAEAGDQQLGRALRATLSGVWLAFDAAEQRLTGEVKLHREHA